MPRRPLALVLAALAATTLAACASSGRGQSSSSTSSSAVSAATSSTAPATTFPAPAHPQTSPAHLRASSAPSGRPAPALTADRDNNRLIVVDPEGRVVWQFPRGPQDLPGGVTFKVPDDAFFSPDGKEIIATEEDDFVISVVDIASHRIVYRYGTPGVHGSGPNQLWNPDDALLLPDGYIINADIKNCRLMLIAPGSHQPARIYGTTTNACRHDPPAHFGSPNGAFPMANGHYLVTEINGSWVDEMGVDGTIYGSWHTPGVSYPSDSNEVSPGVYVTVDYSSPGQLETFDGQGRLIWRYQPRPGDGVPDHPSLALPLPNGDFLMNDDRNHRVVVVDPRTNTVVWQYGVTGQPGAGDGYLDNPDGVDLAPPYSLMIRHARTVGQPTG